MCLLREKNDDVYVGIFDALEVVVVVDDLLDGAAGLPATSSSFSRDPVGFGREAIVAAQLAGVFRGTWTIFKCRTDGVSGKAEIWALKALA